MDGDGDGDRCTYVFDPEQWREETGSPSEVLEADLNDRGVWRCPHEPHDGEHCLFHAPPDEKDDAAVQDELLRKVGARGEHDKQFVGARFGDLDLAYTVVESGDNHPVDLRHARFHGDVTLRSAIVRQPLQLSGARFDGDASFLDAVFEGGAYLSTTTFAGEAYFIETTFRDGATFYLTSMAGDADFFMASFGDDVDFVNATFARVQFRETTFEGRADFTRATFEQAMFWGARFDHIVQFEETTLPRRLNFRETTFDHRVRFDDLSVSESACYLDLRGASVAAGSLSQPADGTVVYDLADATVGDVRIAGDGATGSSLDHFRLLNTTFDGFDFGRYRTSLRASDWTVHDVVTGALPTDVTHDPSVGELETTYLKTKNGADDVGDAKAAAEFFRKEMAYRRRQHARRVRDGTESSWGRARAGWQLLANVALWLTSGYGERPSQVVGFSVAVVTVFTGVFLLFGPETPYGTPVGNLVLSLEAFVTLVLGGAQPVEDPLVRLLAQVEGFSGVFLVALFVFTLTRSIHR